MNWYLKLIVGFVLLVLLSTIFYKQFFKRFYDIVCAFLAFIVFGWLYILIAILVKIKLGSPVIYSAERAGKNGKAFRLYKFRSMINAFDENGDPLPDTERLTNFGRILRTTSLDELPETWNIFKGDMSVIGPRPLPTIYLPYYTEEEHHRHDVKPGLSGWAQVNGRNSLQWEKKFAYDVEYVNNMSFWLDAKIILLSVVKMIKHDDIGQGQEAPESLHILRSNVKKNTKGDLL